MGLNPPFGCKASLANQFISKALQFKPKLLILIVPPEAHRYGHKFSLVIDFHLELWSIILCFYY